jgi:hypothetical protein
MRVSIARLAAAGAVMLMLAPAPAGAQGEQDLARRAAETWLSLVDGGNYAASWETAGAYFRNAVSAEAWAASAGAACGPLGALRSREERSATPATSLPGAPDGEYIVFQFDTAFANKAQAVETVTFLHEPDGIWRAAGYFVR